MQLLAMLVLALLPALSPGSQAIANEPDLAALESQLAADPARLDTRFAYAQALSWAKRWEDALQEYDLLLAVVPDDPDYLLGKAQVLAWSGRPAEALPLLERARRRAPEYQAVVRLEAQVREQLAPRQAQSAEAGFGWQELGGGLPAWNMQYLDYQRTLAPRHLLSGGVQRVERFDQADVELRAGWAQPWTEAWSFALEAGIAPGADVLPRWSGRFRLRRELGEGWGVHGALSHASYAADDLTTAAVGAERYLGAWYGALSVHAGRLQGADTTWSGQLRLERFYAMDSRAGLILAAGRETESIGDGRFLTSSTRGLALVGLHRLTPHWGFGWEWLVHDQGDAYTRRGFRVGLRHDF